MKCLFLDWVIEVHWKITRPPFVACSSMNLNSNSNSWHLNESAAFFPIKSTDLPHRYHSLSSSYCIRFIFVNSSVWPPVRMSRHERNQNKSRGSGISWLSIYKDSLWLTFFLPSNRSCSDGMASPSLSYNVRHDLPGGRDLNINENGSICPFLAWSFIQYLACGRSACVAFMSLFERVLKSNF